MRYETITTGDRLRRYCQDLVQYPSISFDTEFVSEHSYRPELCLIQVSAGGELAVIDAVAIDDVRPFWEAVAAAGHRTIVHAGRSEMEFCLQAVGRRPADLFDVQLAAGLIGIEYPASYGTLIGRLLGEKPPRHETRTDWRRRPLSKRQLEYALNDALHLPRLHEVLHAKLEELGRLDWLREEMAAWQEEVEYAQSHHRWRRVSGISGLRPRMLAVVRELFRWREGEARRRNLPARRVLRDDLIIELARRQTADEARISAVRGLDRGDLRRRYGEIAACIRRALDLPDDQCPNATHRERSPQLSVLGQFLFAALGSRCREARLAPSLVGTPNDIRELVVYRTSKDRPERRVPKLARGWRAEFVGRLFDDLLAGKQSIRIADPTSDHPLAFEPRKD